MYTSKAVNNDSVGIPQAYILLYVMWAYTEGETLILFSNVF
jgi:hypothetical protein